MVIGEESRPDRSAAEETGGRDGELRFSFSGAPWRDVLQWLAEEGDLALHVRELPTGSFTYTDPSLYTHQDAVDRVNLFLLPEGFTLVRSGKLLSVINLGDARSTQQLDAIAQFVTVEQLQDRTDHDVVKCIFPLGKLNAEEAVQELSALRLMSTPAVFKNTNQLMITDTAGKLKKVLAILDAFQPTLMDNGTIVKSFALEHVDAEDVLLVARPHLGLATGEMIGIDVSLSSDVEGKNLFVTGVEDKVKLLEGLVQAIDHPKQSQLATSGEQLLRSHTIEGGNVETIYNVLLTLLADESVRLSMDETASSIVALASPQVQTEIEQTVAQLQASGAEFAVIPLKTIDPFLAVSLLEEMLDLEEMTSRLSAEAEASRRRGNSRGPQLSDNDVPKIDADPGNMRLYVRAKPHMMKQIKEIVAELDAGDSVGSGDAFRILPLRGKQAEDLLFTASKFWRGANPIIFYRQTDRREQKENERVVNGEASVVAASSSRPVARRIPKSLLLAAGSDKQAAEIRCQVTARGLLLQSDDSDGLDRFELQLRVIAGPVDSTPSPPIVFYLQYTKADDAIRVLAELLDGGESASESEAGSLVNGYVSPAQSYLGSIVTSRDGTATMMAGTITVVADARLNRLIAQGTETDIQRIEEYLRIIDKDISITSIETYGTSHVIELVHTKASDVAAAVRDSYAGRIHGLAGPGGSPGQPSSSQKVQREDAAAKSNSKDGGKKSGEKKSASRPVRDLEPKMTIAVHEPSNSLIVTAPQQLFKEVEKLAMLIDAQGQQKVEVIAPVNGELIELVLQQVLLGESVQGRSGSKASARPSSSRSGR